jgi:hypothetical protein
MGMFCTFAWNGHVLYLCLEWACFVSLLGKDVKDIPKSCCIWKTIDLKIIFEENNNKFVCLSRNGIVGKIISMYIKGHRNACRRGKYVLHWRRHIYVRADVCI